MLGWNLPTVVYNRQFPITGTVPIFFSNAMQQDPRYRERVQMQINAMYNEFYAFILIFKSGRDRVLPRLSLVVEVPRYRSAKRGKME